jgi:hypothetical protein
MTRRLIAALGVDYEQWKALTGVCLRIDTRRTGGPRRAHAPRRDSKLRGYRGLVLVTLLQSGVLAGLAVALRDTLTATVMLTTMSAFNTALMLMSDFAGFVVSPDDYWILGSRPVDDRTYFAARVAAVLVPVLVVAATLAIVPAITLAIAHGLGAAGAIAAFGAAVLCAASTAVVTTAVYAALLARVRPERLNRAVGYLQLAASLFFFGGYVFVIKAFEEARIRDLSVGAIAWIWAVPSTWFAAFVPALTGGGGTREWLALGAAVLLTAGCAPLAAGRLSLDFAERLAQAPATSAANRRGRRAVRLPGFGRGEAHAVATLIAAQFRNDLPFRMSILAIVPMTVFYLLLGTGGLTDPFVAEPDGGGIPVYFGVVFMPMTLHGALKFSNSWRASWVFFAAPADPAKLIVAAKNFVAFVFLGSYLLLLAAVAAYYYANVWHAVVHLAVVGAVAHLMLQAAVLLTPSLPFSAEPRQAERSSQLFALMTLGMAVAAMMPTVLPLVYGSVTATVVLIVLLAAATAGLELMVRARARAAVLAMEL